jgi:hypothetical protein
MIVRAYAQDDRGRPVRVAHYFLMLTSPGLLFWPWLEEIDFDDCHC